MEILLYESYNLGEILKAHGVPVEKWGINAAKSVNHLQKEIDNKECYIDYIGPEKELVRFVEFVGINVTYKNFILKEDRQEFVDGRIRRRDMQSSVSEKIIHGEDPKIAAVRGMEEELGLKIDPNQLRGESKLTYYDTSVSKSYPGLKSKYRGAQFDCELTDDQFNKEGYVEVQDDKSTYFVWVKNN
jgi:hypothetical protein